MLEELERDLVYINRKVRVQNTELVELRLKAAKYKALFYGKYDLGKRLDKQIQENLDAEVGEWDGFAYCFWRANAVYRTLENLRDERIITGEEYQFCSLL